MRVEYRYSDEVQKMIDDADFARKQIITILRDDFLSRNHCVIDGNSMTFFKYLNNNCQYISILEHTKKIYALNIPEIIIHHDVAKPNDDS